MKKLYLASLIFACVACGAQKAATKASDLDMERLKRIAAQLDVLQIQAQPLAKERSDIYVKNCASAKVELSVCQIDSDTGVISARPAPPAPVAKK